MNEAKLWFYVFPPLDVNIPYMLRNHESSEEVLYMWCVPWDGAVMFSVRSDSPYGPSPRKRKEQWPGPYQCFTLEGKGASAHSERRAASWGFNPGPRQEGEEEEEEEAKYVGVGWGTKGTILIALL